MEKRKSSSGSTAATIIKVVLLILAVIIILAIVIFVTFYFSNGFGGTYSTFIVKVNGESIVNNRDISLPRGSAVEVISFSDYSVTVTAAEPETDFEIITDAGIMRYSDIAGEDLTSAFEITQTDGGVIVIEYGTIDEVLSAHLSREATVSATPEFNIFNLVITSGNSSLTLPFSPGNFTDGTFIPVYDVQLGPSNGSLII